MKTKLVEVEKVVDTLVEISGHSCSMEADVEYRTTIATREFPGDPEGLKLFQTIEVAETLKEFRELNGLSKEDLVKWLNSNYEQ